MKVAGVVPAKGSSSRLPDKNRQCIRGIPLFLWAANNLNRVLPKQDIYIDSDSDEILAEARAAGFQTIKRPADLATNATDGNRFMIWEAENIACDVLVQHLPPMAFLRESTIRKALDAIASGKQSAFGAQKEQAYVWTEQGPSYDPLNVPNSYTLPPLIREGMGFYATRRDALLHNRTRISRPYEMIELDRYEAIDIDYPHDLDFARSVAAGLPADSEYIKGIGALKRERIKFLVMDMDGVMTDGRLYFSNKGFETLGFHARDGSATRKAIKAGIQVAVLSSTEQPDVLRKRADFIGIKTYMAGCKDKAAQLAAWCEEFKIPPEQTAYLGDDMADLGPMQMAGHAACPADADARIKRIARYALQRKGGHGCVSEFIHTYILDA
ncbi:MAG: HAD hydrolase family protein [Alphaproteobacteria bacterium]|nr:HAD hydrolase family protein [Alphaproteobacteria bacterium]